MLFSNDLFLLDGFRLRLLQADVNMDVAWVINLDEKFAFPECIPYSAIQDNKPMPQKSSISSMLSKSRERKCEEAWNRLKPLIDTHGPKLFEPSFRKFAIDEHANEVGCSHLTLYKDLRRYWQRGQTKFALLPDYNKCGRAIAPGEPTGTELITAGRGRKPRQGHEIFQLTSEDARHLRSVIEKQYLTNQLITVTDAYASLVNKHYRYEDGNQNLHVNPPGARPSLRQFHWFLLNNYDLETRVRGRVGDSDFEREHRKKLGTIMADCQGVGHYYEIDATIADIYLVSSEDVTKIIGKPTMYLIIDRKSRLIVGFYFGLENASWDGAMQAILSIAENKSELCARYGVNYNPDDWPAHQVFPQEFLADRGDMISRASSNIADGLHVTVTNLPSKRPDWKPLVECGFRLIHNSIRPDAPAYDPPSNATRRRGKHYEKDACMTINDFGHLILNTIISHNKREILNYDMSTRELLDEVRPAPIALWNHNLVMRAGLLTRYEEKTVRLALLRKKQAVVTERGIEFQGCFYSFPEAVANKWFERARKRHFKVTVSYDQRLVDSIYVHSLDGKGEPYVASVTDRSSKYRGQSFDEVRCYELLREVVRIESDHLRLQNRVDLTNMTGPVIAAAKARLKAEGAMKSRSSRRADTKPERAKELALERRSMAVIDGGKPLLPPPTKVEPPPPGFAGGNPIPIKSTRTDSAPSMEERLAAARQRMRM